jgi:O-methyltransferase
MECGFRIASLPDLVPGLEGVVSSPSRPIVVEAYLDLLKRAVLNEIYEDHEYERKPRGWRGLFAKHRAPVLVPRRIDPVAREGGQIWPPSAIAHSMIGRRRLDNLQYCIETVVREAIPGDLIETGVWRGGATIFMRGCLLAFEDPERTVWVADSFAGLPPPDPAHPADAGDLHHTIADLAVSLEQVQGNFRRYGLLDERVRFLKGWFKDTLPAAPIRALSVMRLDGDMYGSTMEALRALYERLSPGGFVIIDDYCIQSCRQAVTEFRAARGIVDAIVKIDEAGVFWRKS